MRVGVVEVGGCVMREACGVCGVCDVCGVCTECGVVWWAASAVCGVCNMGCGVCGLSCVSERVVCIVGRPCMMGAVLCDVRMVCVIRCRRRV